MANTILFYNVDEAKSDNFKTSMSAQKVIGFVSPSASGEFGYLLAGGKQYGASQKAIENIATNKANTAKTEAINAITVNEDKNSLFGDGGAKYTFSFDNGELSVSKYLATTLTAKTSNVESSAGNGSSSNMDEQFIGTSYTLDPVIVISDSANQILNYTVNNTTGNEWTITGIKTGSTYVMGQDVASLSQSGGKYTYFEYSKETTKDMTYYLTKEKLVSAPSVKATGKVAWAGTKTVTANIASKQFTVYLHEAGLSGLATCTVTLAATTASKALSVKAKAKWYKHTAEISTGATGTATSTSYPNMPSSLSVDAGLPSFAYPKEWNKKPTFRQLGEDTGWVEKPEITIEGVKYRVFVAPSNTGSTQEYTITWA